MKISQKGLDFIKGFESFVPWVYDDLVAARKVNGKLVYREWNGEPVKGTLTIGYGHTNAARHPLKIAKGLRITEKQACEILDRDLDDCEEAVRRLVKVPLTQGQFDALVSITFNMGEGNLKKSSLLARLNRGDYKGARAAFDLYVKSKGKTLPGLQRRRDGEQALWDAGYVAVPDDPVDHPAEIDSPRKSAREAIRDSKSLRFQLNALVTFVAGVLWTAWDWLSWGVLWLLSWLPGAAEETSAAVSAVQTVAAPLKVAVPVALLFAITLCCLLALFARQLTTKMEG